ncbi:hypothetical protein L484_010903 [Morus notabilis]|uniref:Uncharacterized protein n=1 Tax=Morus notabilis TaxID=981085 RepID=W9QZ53_9ROSA|nr:hypothetical protein L484_010903 [Morus notabilis]
MSVKGVCTVPAYEKWVSVTQTQLAHHCKSKAKPSKGKNKSKALWSGTIRITISRMESPIV